MTSLKLRTLTFESSSSPTNFRCLSHTVLYDGSPLHISAYVLGISGAPCVVSEFSSFVSSIGSLVMNAVEQTWLRNAGSFELYQPCLPLTGNAP